MKTKFLACDVDGTLLQHNSQYISNTDLKAIQNFRELGNIFALCTGRSETWTIPLLEQNNLHCDALILSNGSDIYTVNEHNYLDIKRIKSEVIPNAICQEIIKYFYDQNSFTICWDDGTKTFEMADRLLDKETSIIQESKATLASYEEFQKSSSPIININLAPIDGSVEKAIHAKEEISKRWGQQIDIFRNQFFVDVAPKNSSKGSGITNMVAHLEFQGEVYGVGDSYNDVPMFETLGTNNSFVMANGEADLFTYGTKVMTVAECIDIILNK